MTSERPFPLGEVARYVIVGAGNTLVTGFLFYALALMVPAVAAYAVSYGVGILVAGLLIPSIVFRRPPSVKVSGRVSAGYLVVLLVGVVLVRVLEDRLDTALLVLTTLSVTLPTNFIVARWLSGQGR